jgi:hypothetical protein
VLYAVIEECEHQRRALEPEETASRLRQIAREKLAEIHRPYMECGGTEPYWAELSREVLDTALPQYIPAAIEKNRLERAAYDLWRRGDLAARGLLGLGGLALGGIMVRLPFIPIWEDAFAFALTLCGFFYPEVKRLYLDFRHTRLLNRLVNQADRYQRNRLVHYVSEQLIETELEQALHAPLPHAGREEQAPHALLPHAGGEEEAPRAAPPHAGREEQAPHSPLPHGGREERAPHAPLPHGGRDEHEPPPAGRTPPLRFPRR